MRDRARHPTAFARRARSRAAPSRVARGSDWTDQGRVDGQLGSVEERQTISDHFQATVIQLGSWQEVEVVDPDVGGYPRSRFSADAWPVQCLHITFLLAYPGVSDLSARTTMYSV